MENKSIVLILLLILWAYAGAHGYHYYADRPVQYETVPLGKEIMPDGRASILEIDREVMSGPSMIYSCQTDGRASWKSTGK